MVSERLVIHFCFPGQPRIWSALVAYLCNFNQTYRGMDDENSSPPLPLCSSVPYVKEHSGEVMIYTYVLQESNFNKWLSWGSSSINWDRRHNRKSRMRTGRLVWTWHRFSESWRSKYYWSQKELDQHDFKTCCIQGPTSRRSQPKGLVNKVFNKQWSILEVEEEKEGHVV